MPHHQVQGGASTLRTIRLHPLLTYELLEIGLRAMFADSPAVACQSGLSREKPLLPQLPQPGDGYFDIVMLDTLPDDDMNPNWVFHLKRNRPSLGVIYLLPLLSSEGAITKALRSGADGYLFHTAAQDDIVRAVQTVSEGRAFIQPDITPIVLDELRRPRFTVLASDVQVVLTGREGMLLQLAADGLSNSQISEVFHVHGKTVRNMWSVLFHKLGMNDRTQAVLWAVRNGQAELR